MINFLSSVELVSVLFSFSKYGCQTKIKDPICPTIYPKLKKKLVPLCFYQGHDKFLSGIELVCIQFSFSKIGYQTKAKRPSHLNYYPLLRGRTGVFVTLSRALVICEIRTAKSRNEPIISDSNNYYIKPATIFEVTGSFLFRYLTGLAVSWPCFILS